MEFVRVLVAAACGFAVGAAWYMSLARPWMAAAGIKVDARGRPEGNGSPLPFLISGIAMLVVAGFLRHIFTVAEIDTLAAGLLYGGSFGLFVITPWLAMDYAYAMRPSRLTLIDGGYAIAGCAVMGAVLNLF